MSNMNKIHDLRLEEILADPLGTIGIRGVRWGATGVEFRSRRSGRVLAEADLLLYTGDTYDKPITVVEYKMSRAKRDRAIEQLHRLQQMVRRDFNADCYRVFAWEQYKRERW